MPVAPKRRTFITLKISRRSTGHPDPGRVQGAGGYVAGADIVEYNPRQDLGGVTATVAAKLVKEVAGRMMGDEVPRRGAAVEIESPRSTI